jgi:hypothetical protein
MVTDGRAAGIKVGGRWIVHLPSTLSLVARGAVWGPCPHCETENSTIEFSRDSRISRTSRSTRNCLAR